MSREYSVNISLTYTSHLDAELPWLVTAGNIKLPTEIFHSQNLSVLPLAPWPPFQDLCLQDREIVRLHSVKSKTAKGLCGENLQVSAFLSCSASGLL